MTRDDIIRMAVEAGFLTNELGSYLISPYTFEDQDLFDEFERFAKLVAAAEKPWVKTYCGGKPNYTTPQKREWVGLTDGEIAKIYDDCDEWDGYEYERAIEAKLKEKNNG